MNVGPLHHVTAMSGDPRETLTFYESVLGLRRIKVTVNFDDPSTYHLYFGDGVGAPGTACTFFPWPLARQGVRGAGQCTSTQLSIPEGSTSFWLNRLAGAGVTAAAQEDAFGHDVVQLFDPHGLLLELVESDETGVRTGWDGSDVPADARVFGLHGVALTVRELGPTQSMLEFLGFAVVGQSSSHVRFRSAQGGPGSHLDVLVLPGAAQGRVSKGTVHHVAFRVANDTVHAEWVEHLRTAGVDASPIMDRQYFRSIYFTEPGGVLFELATDGPGFTVDEPVATLGERLMLPPQLESRRVDIQRNLTPLEAWVRSDASAPGRAT